MATLSYDSVCHLLLSFCHDDSSLVHTNYSESDYLNETWNLVSDFVKQALENSSEQHEPISYQAIYWYIETQWWKSVWELSFHSSQIYKTACKGYKERIFDDLGTLITEHCQQLKRHFDESVRDFMPLFNDDSSLYCSRWNGVTLVAVMQRWIGIWHNLSKVLINITTLSTSFLHSSYENRSSQTPDRSFVFSFCLALPCQFDLLDSFRHIWDLSFSSNQEVVYIKPKLYSTVREQLILLLRTIVIEPHINPVFSKIHPGCWISPNLWMIFQRYFTNCSIRLLVHRKKPSIYFCGWPTNWVQVSLLLIETVHCHEDGYAVDCAVSERVLFQRYCNGEDVLEEMLVPEPFVFESVPLWIDLFVVSSEEPVANDQSIPCRAKKVMFGKTMAGLIDSRL